MTQLLSIGQVAQLLGVSRATCYRMARDGGLPVTRSRGRVMRVSARAFDEWCREQDDEALVAARRRKAA